jgi:DNA-binding GntR family transcriptional regulator
MLQPGPAAAPDRDRETRLPLGSTVYQRVHERLRDDILSGAIAQGTRLKIADIAARYGLSQMPVREALQQLQGEGLVVLAPNRGATVRRMDARFIRNLFAIREALDTMLTADAAALMDAPTLARVREAQARFDRAAAAGDHRAAAHANHAFHRTIMEATGNDEALRLLDTHAGLIQAMRARFGYRPGRLEAVSADHAALVAALAAGDAEAARSIELAHLRAARDDLLAVLEAEEAATAQDA